MVAAVSTGLLSLSCASGPESSFRHVSPDGTVPVGIAQIDITPKEPVRLAGYPRTIPFERVVVPIRASAIAFGADGSSPAIVIATELIGIPRSVSDEVARRLARAGVAREQLVVAATHTHTGPELAYRRSSSSLPADQRAASERYSGELVDQLERVALAALADRRPARVTWAQGSAELAENRRIVENGRYVRRGTNVGGPVDHDLPVMRITDPDGRLRGVWFTYACHATTLEPEHNFIHPDWPGTAARLIEARHPGAAVVVTVGTGGDQRPNTRGDGLPDVLRNARLIEEAVERAIAVPGQPIRDAPEGRIRFVELDWEPVAAPAGATVPPVSASGGKISTSYPIQTWRFGDELAMVFLGGEVVVDYALRLKRELDPTRLWVNAYANDVAFYVASERLLPEGGYEVEQTIEGRSAQLVSGSEEQIVATVRALLPRSFSAAPR